MKRTDLLLIGGVVLGILAAMTGLADAGRAPLSEATAALVNDTPIPADELRSLLERRTRSGAPADQLLATLDDMIDEELLIQRALELGILRRDSNVRLAIIQAMEKSILNEERGRSFSDAELEAFYRNNTALFAEPLRLQLEELVVADPARVAELAARLRAGASANRLAAGDDGLSVTNLPPVPLSLEALARRISADILPRLETAAEGDVLTYRSGRGTHLIRVVAIEEASVPPFAELRFSVLNELQLQRQNAAYDEYLAWLRQRADIRKNESLAR
jgi:parvulin-like peptidyl-prolyl isomerase